MRNAWIVLATLWLVVFATSCQFLIVAPLLPEIGVALEVPEALLGTLVSSYAVMVGVFALVAGPISDRLGRRTILRVGSGFMAVALFLHAVAGSFGSLLALRALAGMASGVLSGAAAAYVGDVFPYERRGHALGWVMSGMAFGQILGIPAGTLLAGWWGFQAPFVVFGVVMLLAWILTLTILPPAPPAHEEVLSVGSAVQAYRELLARRDIVAVSLSGMLMMVGVSCFIVYLPAWMEARFQATPLDVAWLFGLGGISSAIAGRLSDQLGRKALVVSGALGMAAMTLVIVQVRALWVLDVAFFVVMGLASMRMGPLNALLTAMVGPERRGTLLSLTMAVSQGGFALGSAMAGGLYASWGFLGNMSASAVATVLGALLLAFLVPEPPLGGHA